MDADQDVVGVQLARVEQVDTPRVTQAAPGHLVGDVRDDQEAAGGKKEEGGGKKEAVS